jgi:Phycobilisome protein
MYSVQSFAKLWAEKYVQHLLEVEHSEGNSNGNGANGDNRVAIAQELSEKVRFASLQAWAKTEALLLHEIKRHQISQRLINPWEIARDAHVIYEGALRAYAKQVSPQQFSVLTSANLGRLRQKYTTVDPRVIGFVSMQFHYCGQQLISEPLPEWQRMSLREYFKVIDDHLYMPLQRTYNAAGNHDPNSPPLKAVRRLLPVSSDIARKVVARVMKLYPNYHSYSGSLNHPDVQLSGLRDVEMFQTYLWVCMLEGNISAIRDELFPLCLILYPSLKVSWELVQQMIYLIGCEIQSRLRLQKADYYDPYYQAMTVMFSQEVLPSTLTNF